MIIPWEFGVPNFLKPLKQGNLIKLQELAIGMSHAPGGSAGDLRLPQDALKTAANLVFVGLYSQYFLSLCDCIKKPLKEAKSLKNSPAVTSALKQVLF